MAPRSPRRPPEQKRAEILEAARTCFTERGYHETRIDQIAERADVSKGAIYWYFEGKRELFLELLDRYIDEQAPRLATAGQGAASASEAVRALLRTMSESISQTLPTIELIVEYMAHASRDEALRERFRRGDGLTRSALEPMLERGIQDGEFRKVDVKQAADVILSVVNGVVLLKVIRPEVDLEAVWATTMELLLRGLRPDATR